MTDQGLFALPFDEVLRRTAARSSFPGGGAACAMACALAASLVAMAGRFTGDAAAHVVGRAEAVVDELAVLAQEDAEAFGELLATWRLPREDPGRSDRVAAAALRACEVPLGICRIGADLAGSAAWLATAGKPDLHGDAFTAGQLAQAGVRGAAQLVQINARQAADPRVADEARDLVERTARLVDGTEGLAR
jgi:formiminotetrahydrofolate cyclodeaminase